MESNTKKTIVITPKARLLDIDLKEVLKYRGLVYALIKRNYEVQYKQTILGPWWVILGQIFSSGLFSFVFGYIGNFNSEGTPYFLFHMSGSLVWGYFAACMYGNSSIFLSNSYLFGKVYFPRLIIPISNALFDLIKVGMQLCVCFCVWGVFFARGEVGFMGWYILALPFIFIIAGLQGLAIGLIVSSLTTKYRDLSHLVGMGMQIMMYCSPVLYSDSNLPEMLKKIIRINPMTSLINAGRYCITGAGEINLNGLLYSLIFTLVMGFIGIILFNQTEKTFIDII